MTRKDKLMLSQKELVVLEATETGNSIPENCLRLAEQMASVGLVRIGRHRGLTTTGRHYLQRSRLERTAWGWFRLHYLRPLFGIG